MEIIKKPLTNGQYLNDPIDKKAIFLHHTVGLSAMSAWRWWNTTPDRVGTAYIIDLDGTVIECFDPIYWAYHLGIKSPDKFMEKHSIGIELVSAGPLRFEANEFRFYPLWPNKTRFTVIPKEEVIEIKGGWRGFNYYHKYTDKQISSLEELLNGLLNLFPNIRYEVPVKDIMAYNPDVITKKLGGIWSHTTVRDDKNDLYPDKRIISVVRKATEVMFPPDTTTFKS
jgi:N-acetyl-anhydromuramyl-L-alanine amidase AmpD